MFVNEMRSRGREYPDFDPNDGGVNARALVLLTTPGPKAVESNFVSCDNPDKSASNMRRTLEISGVARKHIVLWNVVPYFISTPDTSKNPSLAEIKLATPDTQRLIGLLPKLSAIVFCGATHTQKALRWLNIPVHIKIFKTNHTGGKAYNKRHFRKDIHLTFQNVANEIADHRR